MQIDIRADIAEAKRRLGKIQREIADKAIVSALNKTIDKGRAEMVRAITEEYVLPASDVRARLRVQKANRSSMVAVLDPFASRRRGRSLNMIHFVEKKTTMADARKRKKAGTLEQLHFQVKKVGGKKMIKGAFIGNKGRTVFVRTGKERLPIKALSTIDVPSMFNSKRIKARVAAKIGNEFKVEFDRALRMWMSKS